MRSHRIRWKQKRSDEIRSDNMGIGSIKSDEIDEIKWYQIRLDRIRWYHMRSDDIESDGIRLNQVRSEEIKSERKGSGEIKWDLITWYHM